MRNDITLTDEQIEAAFEAAGAYLTADELTFSHETLQDFATASVSIRARHCWRAMRRWRLAHHHSPRECCLSSREQRRSTCRLGCHW